MPQIANSARQVGDVANVKLMQLHSQVEDVKDAMAGNIKSALERGENLNDLIDKSTELEGAAIEFSVRARKVRRKMWCLRSKMLTLLSVIVFLLFVVFVTGIVLHTMRANTLIDSGNATVALATAVIEAVVPNDAVAASDILGVVASLGDSQTSSTV